MDFYVKITCNTKKLKRKWCSYMFTALWRFFTRKKTVLCSTFFPSTKFTYQYLKHLILYCAGIFVIINWIMDISDETSNNILVKAFEYNVDICRKNKHPQQIPELIIQKYNFSWILWEYLIMIRLYFIDPTTA